MRAVRVIFSIIFVVVLCVYAYVNYTKSVDTTFPVIKSDVKVIEASVDDDNSALLGHITATDGKDGDISSAVVVEKVSAFISKGKVNVTFAVSDADNNISKLTVPVVYTDYTDPEITLLDDLVFKTGGPASVKDAIKVTDKIDGDITDRLVVIANETDSTVSGNYPITIKVTNSKSYTYTLDIDLIMSDYIESGYEIELSEYLIYKKVGESVDYNSYISSASVPYGKDESYDIQIDSKEVDPNTPGIYNAYYYEKVGGEIKSMTRLIVCYEE